MIKAVTYYHTDSWIISGWKRQGQMKQEVRNAYIPNQYFNHETNKQRTTPSFDIILSSSKMTLKNKGLWGDQNYSLFPKPDGLEGLRTGRQPFVKLSYFVFQFPFRNQCHISLLKGVVGILFFKRFLLERLGLDGPREDSIYMLCLPLGYGNPGGGCRKNQSDNWWMVYEGRWVIKKRLSFVTSVISRSWRHGNVVFLFSIVYVNRLTRCAILWINLDE